jgi:DHA1 family multidrug resistance protein-like MFS transporter
MGYTSQIASIFAGNCFFRSTMAAFFPLFGHHFFTVLGLGGGSSLLAGLNILMILPLWILLKYGKKLRQRSKWADAQ